MSFEPRPENNSKPILETRLPNLEDDTPKRHKEFDILRKILGKEGVKTDINGRPLLKANESEIPVKNQYTRSGEMSLDSPEEPSQSLINELWMAIENEPDVQRKLKQLNDEDRQRSILEPILRKKWLELLQESVEIDQEIISVNRDLLNDLQGKTDPASLAMSKDLILSTKKLENIQKINIAEIETALADKEYWLDAHQKSTIEKDREPTNEPDKPTSQERLVVLRKNILGLREYLTKFEVRDLDDKETALIIKRLQVAIKKEEELVALEESLMHNRNPFDQVYIAGSVAKTGEIPRNPKGWQETQMPETTS